MLKEATVWLSYTPKSSLNTSELSYPFLRPKQLCFPILYFSLPKLLSPISLPTGTLVLKSTQLHPGFRTRHFPQTQITVSLPCPQKQSLSGHALVHHDGTANAQFFPADTKIFSLNYHQKFRLLRRFAHSL